MECHHAPDSVGSGAERTMRPGLRFLVTVGNWLSSCNVWDKLIVNFCIV